MNNKQEMLKCFKKIIIDKKRQKKKTTNTFVQQLYLPYKHWHKRHSTHLEFLRVRTLWRGNNRLQCPQPLFLQKWYNYTMYSTVQIDTLLTQTGFWKNKNKTHFISECMTKYVNMFTFTYVQCDILCINVIFAIA